MVPARASVLVTLCLFCLVSRLVRQAVWGELERLQFCSHHTCRLYKPFTNPSTSIDCFACRRDSAVALRPSGIVLVSRTSYVRLRFLETMQLESFQSSLVLDRKREGRGARCIYCRPSHNQRYLIT